MSSCVAMVWRKSWISFGSTFIAELENDQLSLIYGGGALADCQLTAGRTNTDAWNRISIERGVGQAVANKMVNGQTNTLNKNIEAYNNGERSRLLEHKKSVHFALADIVDVDIIDKPSSSDPMAVKGHDTGIIQFKVEGKRWRMAIRKSTPNEVQSWAASLS